MVLGVWQLRHFRSFRLIAIAARCSLLDRLLVSPHFLQLPSLWQSLVEGPFWLKLVARARGEFSARKVALHIKIFRKSDLLPYAYQMIQKIAPRSLHPQFSLLFSEITTLFMRLF